MKDKPSEYLEDHRLKRGEFASDESYGNNGVFDLMFDDVGLVVIASDGMGWDHVSVHTHGARCPTWEEMDYVRKLFFRDDEWVMQLHAPASKHINEHPYTLHLWRPQNDTIPIPPPMMV